MTPKPHTTPPGQAVGRPGLIVLAVGGLGVSAVVTQLVLMREMLAAFAGNEMVLGIILGNWLLLTGLGAFLGRTAGWLSRPGRLLVCAQMLIALLPLAQLLALRILRDMVFVRGAMVGVTETVVAAFVLLLPYCLVSGYMLTLACSMLAGPAGIGRVYVADSLGSIVGGVVFTFVLVRLFDHAAALYVPAFANLALAGLAGWRLGPRVLAAGPAVLAAGLAATIALVNLDELSTAVQHPGQRVVFRGNSPYGRLVVTEADGQFTFWENGQPVVSSDNIEQAEETAHYAMAQRPGAARVLLIGGGVSGAAREVLKYNVREVTCVELDPLIIELGRKFLPDALADPRITVVTTDGRLFIRRTDARFDVVIIDLPDPTTSQLNRFYTAELFSQVRRVLADGGVLSFTLGRYENYVSGELARLLGSADRTLKTVFRNVTVIPAGQVFFLASDGPLHLDIADRLQAAGVATRLVGRHYLDAMLTGDRLADVRRACSSPAQTNTDFNPVLYYYALRRWMSQFTVRFGVLEGVLLVGLAAYLLRLRPVPGAVFASGFAASSLEVVLLLGFQILYGSVYRQVGLIVTVFMAGLAAGAFLAGRLRRAGRGTLAGLAFGLAGYGAALPLLLKGLGHAGASSPALAAVQVAIGLLTFGLAVLVGMQFPLACRVDFRTAASTASRIYTADFVGACLGALLASTLLIPLLGVAATSLVTAGLNLVAGTVLLVRKG